MGSIGMATGIGGASIISRAFGEKNDERAYKTFGNMIALVLVLTLSLTIVSFIFSEQITALFGGKGSVLAPANEYFRIVLFGIPFLAWAMMANNVIRAEGYPKIAMFTLITPAVVNLILDPIFIIYYGWGMFGAGLATTIGYVFSAGFTFWYFLGKKSEMRLQLRSIILDWRIVKEIAAIGSVTLARQSTISVLSIVLNNSLFAYGGEIAIAMYGLVNRIMLFLNFPTIGITQGFVPIAGYNYGAKLKNRVTDLIKIAMQSATVLAGILFIIILIFTPIICGLFTDDEVLIQRAIPAVRISLLATPLIAINLIGSAYFQATGKAMAALLLALSKQGFFLIPLILILPLFFGLNGIWYSFPIADVLAAILTFIYLRYKRKQELLLA
jgi:putative MATE family efflux protein